MAALTCQFERIWGLKWLRGGGVGLGSREPCNLDFGQAGLVLVAGLAMGQKEKMILCSL